MRCKQPEREGKADHESSYRFLELTAFEYTDSSLGSIDSKAVLSMNNRPSASPLFSPHTSPRIDPPSPKSLPPAFCASTPLPPPASLISASRSRISRLSASPPSVSHPAYASATPPSSTTFRTASTFVAPSHTDETDQRASTIRPLCFEKSTKDTGHTGALNLIETLEPGQAMRSTASDTSMETPPLTALLTSGPACSACKDIHSQYTDCVWCHGSGKANCSQCPGQDLNHQDEVRTCNVCNAQGAVYCKPCNGSGKTFCACCTQGRIRCDRCGGAGSLWTTVVPPWYAQELCPSYLGGCHGAWTSCDSCEGETNMPCPHCDMTGFEKRYRTLADMLNFADL